MEAEEDFLASVEKDHPYAYPVERTAAALGYEVDDETIVDIDVLSEDGRALLVSFQRANRLRATGYLDHATFQRLLHEPVDPNKFKISDPHNDTPEAIGDWFFSRGDAACTIWTKPVQVHGTFAPDFNELPLVSITRFLNMDDSSLLQTYAEGELFAEKAEVVVRTDRELKTERLNGDYGPLRSCDGDNCGGSDEVLKEFRAASSFNVVGESAFGGELDLTYSAAGFTKAFQRLDRECGRGKLGTWLR
jgi:hypothetical protein